MAGNEVGTGYVPIKPDTEGFGPELEKGIEREGTPAAKRGAQTVSRAMKGVFLAGAALIGKSVLDFGAFDKGMREVFTLLPGISGDAMTEMTGQVKSFATQFGVLPTDVVPALYQSLSAGVPADNVFAFIETAQKLAKGGVTDLTTSVDGLSSVVNAYGSDVLSAEQASDLMFTTVKLGKTNIAELSASLFQVTPTAAGLGVAFSDVTGALAAMTLQGVPTSVATTQLRQLLVELSKDGSKTAAVFQEMSGKTFRDFIAGGGNLQGALQIIETGAKDSGLAISDMFGSVEAGSAALALTGGGTEAFTNSLAGMSGAAGATDAAFSTMNAGLSATLDRLKARFAVTLLNIGEQIAPTIGAVGNGIGLLLDLFGKLPPQLQAVAVLLGTVGAGLFAFARPIMSGIELFGKLGKVWSLLAANPWVLVLAGLITITVLIIKNWTTVKNVLAGVFAWLKTAAGFVAAFYVALWRNAIDVVTGAWRGFVGALQAAVRVVVGAVNAMWSAVGTVMGGIVSAVTSAWSAVTSATSAAWDALWSIVSGIGGAVVGFITGIPSAISSAFETLADVITIPFTTAFGLIKRAWNDTVGGFGFKAPSWIPFVGGKSFTIPSMAAGGVAGAPMLAMIGEYPGAKKNPEIVTPQNIMRDTVAEAISSAGAASGTAPVSITIEMHVTSEVRDPGFFERQATELARVVAREFERSGLARGTVLTGRAA